MSSPTEPTYSWPTCEIPEPTTIEAVRIIDADTVAAAIQKAAIEILNTGMCPDTHPDRGIRFGRPLTRDECCGEVQTGIVTAQVIPAGRCITPLDIEWVLRVSWCEGKQSVANQSRDAMLLFVRLPEVVQCLLQVTGEPPRKFNIVGADNTPDESSCQNLFLTIRSA